MNRIDALETLKEYLVEISDSIQAFTFTLTELEQFATVLQLDDDKMSLTKDTIHNMMATEESIKIIIQSVINDIDKDDSLDLTQQEIELYVTTCDEYEKIKHVRIRIFESFDLFFKPVRKLN